MVLTYHLPSNMFATRGKWEVSLCFVAPPEAGAGYGANSGFCLVVTFRKLLCANDIFTNPPEGDRSGGWVALGRAKKRWRCESRDAASEVMHPEQLRPRRPTRCLFLELRKNKKLKQIYVVNDQSTRSRPGES